MPRTPLTRLALAAALALTAGVPTVARGEFFVASDGGGFIIPLDPRGTYLRVNGEAPPAAMPIDLLALGIRSGDLITLTRLGDFRRGGTPPFDKDVFLDLTAVFSSSAALGPPGDQYRVLGALYAGLDFKTVPTFVGGLPTDIPEDFEVSNFDGTVTSVTVRVPAGARFLFLATADSFFSDNADPDGDFGVRITVVPEPASLVLLAVGGLGLLGYGWRRRVNFSPTASTSAQ